jgi:hypothetical protein
MWRTPGVTASQKNFLNNLGCKADGCNSSRMQLVLEYRVDGWTSKRVQGSEVEFLFCIIVQAKSYVEIFQVFT